MLTRGYLTEEAIPVTSHTNRIVLLSRVSLKSWAKYQSVTLLISYLSVLLSTLPEHKDITQPRRFLPRCNNLCKQLKLLPFVFYFWRSYIVVKLISPLRTLVLYLSSSLSHNCNFKKCPSRPSDVLMMMWKKLLSWGGTVFFIVY